MRLVIGAEKTGKQSIPASEGWHRLTIRKMSSADGVSCRMDTPSAYCRDFFVFLKLLLSAGRGLLIFLIPFPLADGHRVLLVLLPYGPEGGETAQDHVVGDAVAQPQEAWSFASCGIYGR